MDEPDADELEWMACEQFPPEEEPDYYFEEFPPEAPEPQPPGDQPAYGSHDDDGIRKRGWQDNDPGDNGSGNAAAKKARGSNSGSLGQSLLSSLPLAMDSSVDREWSPPPPPNIPSKLRSQLPQNGNDLSSTLSTEKPWSPPNPPETKESLPMLPPQDQEGGPIREEEPPIPCRLPHRRAADIDGDYVSITGPNGERVYAAKVGPIKTSYNGSASYGKGLLGEPIAKMIERLEREMFEQVIAESDKKIQQRNELEEPEPATKHEDLWVDKYAPRSFTELLSDEQTNREVLGWLKKWDPCVFGGKKVSTSQEVLTALRRQVTQTTGGRGFARGRGFAEGRGFSGGRGSYKTSNNWNMPSHDEFSEPEPEMKPVPTESPTLDRPEEKVLLLCGPPGLGKTTLAHVVARHCGYRVVEINASDDRVATTLKGKILDAIQMKSVMGENRPNCLVIDEIDGALSGAEGKGAIDALLEIVRWSSIHLGGGDIQGLTNDAHLIDQWSKLGNSHKAVINAEKKLGQGKENKSDEEFTKKNSRKKGPVIRRLSRPVICICNDLYVPALRALRQVARVHVFAQPSTTRVVSRLKYICGKEGYKTNARALTALASHTEGDIRSCLNTLQFLNRKKQNLKTLDVGSQVIGRKDMTSSIFDIWGEVFHRRKARPGAVMRGMVDMPESGNREHKDFVRLYGLISNHGDFELSLDGVHENILHMRYHDASLHKTVEALQWMGDSQIYSHRIMAKQQFHLLAYQPSTLLAIRGLVAQQERPQINWPRAYQKCRTEHAVKTELLNSWCAAMTASVSRTLSPSCLSQDMVTPILSILTPPTIRPVAPQLLSVKEKEEVTELVDTMIGFGISYKHQKPGVVRAQYGVDAQNALVLDPPIDSLVKYTDYCPGYHQLSSTLCEMLAHEVEIGRILRDGALRGSRMGEINSTKIKPIPGSSTTKGETKSLSGLPESQAKLVSEGTEPLHKKVNPTPSKDATDDVQERPQPRQPKNFFERFKKSAKGEVSAEAKAKEKLATLQRDSRPLLYKYQEGFTNAIKRPMLMRDFL